MNKFDQWWQKEEDLMRQQGADDDAVLGAMRSIAEMAWDAALEAVAISAGASCEQQLRSQWQPIETAPQDGAKFLLLGTNNEISFCRWHEEVGAWCYGGLIGPVDHECLWMPLPQPPKS